MILYIKMLHTKSRTEQTTPKLGLYDFDKNNLETKASWGFDTSETRLSYDEQQELLSIIALSRTNECAPVRADEAKACMLTCYLGLVANIVRKTMGINTPKKGEPKGTYLPYSTLKNPLAVFEDRFQAGVIGLINAINRGVPGKGAEFATYAAFHIQCKIEQTNSTEEFTGVNYAGFGKIALSFKDLAKYEVEPETSETDSAHSDLHKHISLHKIKNTILASNVITDEEYRVLLAYYGRQKEETDKAVAEKLGITKIQLLFIKVHSLSKLNKYFKKQDRAKELRELLYEIE